MRRWIPVLALGALFFTSPGYAKTAQEIDTAVDAAMDRFKREVIGADDVLARAKGVLVMPKIIKGGIGFGAEYGEGSLRVNGKSVDYYNTIAGSWGIQLGGQVRSIYVFFLEQSALDKFRASSGWKFGADASVVLISAGAGGSIDTMKSDEPILAFMLGQKGLMGNLTLELGKFNKTVK
ncbi:MAG: hypothetical protein HY714_06210 [Candidatus Omnitrophica bacterium]|nr:hypothetical protein [Candidatus Omnitrophota bacterium]